MDNIVEIEGLTKIFKPKGPPVREQKTATALAGLDLSVRKGEIFGLIGPDGAGKTTTLRILCGLLNPSGGTVRVFGKELPREIEKIRDSLGYMSQKFSLYADLSVAENLAFFADIYGVQGAALAARLENLYAMTRLTEFKNRQAGKLSGGMKQKLALMCTLLPRPGLLLLDEPTTGVDPISRREFWEILQSLLADGVTIIVSTPYLDEAEWCTRIGLLHEGRFLACASPRELKNNIGVLIAEGRLADENGQLPDFASAASGIRDVHRLGARIRFALRDRAAFASLKKAAGETMAIRETDPMIEDVFMEKVREAGR